MPTDPANRLIDHLFRCILPGGGDEQADGELLARFIERHDEAALAAIVRRHAGMVWGVCNRALQNQQDAEDAFQSTFLVLVRKATSIVPRGNVGNWLYGVANQVTKHAKRGIARRRTREVQVIEMPDSPAQPGISLDLRFVLDEELVRLPDIYRAVVVLCDLEGRTRKEAARLLGVPDGTVAGRLARARALLAERLTRRGVVFSGGSMATALSAASVSASAPPALVASTIKAASVLAAGKVAAAGAISVKVATLTDGVIQAMFVTKLKSAIAVVLIFGIMATGATLLTFPTAAGQDGKKSDTGKPKDFIQNKGTEQEGASDRKELKPGVPDQAPKQEDFTAWGAEAGGLQAGLSYVLPRRSYTYGEAVQLTVRIRNVSKNDIKFKYLKEFFIETMPVVTDIDGHAVFGAVKLAPRPHNPVDANVAPGKEVELAKLAISLKPMSDGIGRSFSPNLFGRNGKVSLQYEQVFGMSSAGQFDPDPVLSKLATGKLELHIMAAALPGATEQVPPKEERRGELPFQATELKTAVEQPAPTNTLLKQPETAKRNIAASPKFDPRVFVYRAESITGKIEEYNPDGKEIALDVGARDGVHFGYAFQIGAAGSKDSIGVAKVVELEPRRCIARVVTLNPANAATSLKGLTVVCAPPPPDKTKTSIEVRSGKNVWQTESLENKIIRGLLESNRNVDRILIVQDDK